MAVYKQPVKLDGGAPLESRLVMWYFICISLHAARRAMEAAVYFYRPLSFSSSSGTIYTTAESSCRSGTPLPSFPSFRQEQKKEKITKEKKQRRTFCMACTRAYSSISSISPDAGSHSSSTSISACYSVHCAIWRCVSRGAPLPAWRGRRLPPLAYLPAPPPPPSPKHTFALKDDVWLCLVV